jgi:hypothetical protein
MVNVSADLLYASGTTRKSNYVTSPHIPIVGCHWLRQWFVRAPISIERGHGENQLAIQNLVPVARN